MKKQDTELNGLILVDKPAWTPPGDGTRTTENAPMTSHDVVQRIRRWSGQRRIGHTGTLDPMASGLLVLCLGWATRLVEYYQGHDKEYQAEVTLGWATDTLDALGTPTERAAVPPLDSARIETALAGFRGTVLQRPPVFSALKQGGESLHYKARRGEVVEVEARTVTFHRIDLLEFLAPDRIVLDVRCSAGAYIRSFACDLGRALGTAATLTALRRTGAGHFRVEMAHSLDALATAARDGCLARQALPPGFGLDMPAIAISSETAFRLGFGQIVAIADGAEAADGIDLAMCQDGAGTLLGIIRHIRPQGPDNGPTLWKAEKWFA